MSAHLRRAKKGHPSTARHRPMRTTSLKTSILLGSFRNFMQRQVITRAPPGAEGSKASVTSELKILEGSRLRSTVKAGSHRSVALVRRSLRNCCPYPIAGKYLLD
jgi:hypothetical protein